MPTLTSLDEAPQDQHPKRLEIDPGESINQSEIQ